MTSKLSPGRTSLSGRPEFLRPAPVQTSPVVAAPRQCCMCGLLDVAHLVEGEPHHTVTVELKFLTAQNEAQAREHVSGYLKTRGWRYRYHLGRHAMERDICRACLMAHQEIGKEFARKRSNELKSHMQSDSYYRALCGD